MFPRVIFNVIAVLRATRDWRRRDAFSNSVPDGEDVRALACSTPSSGRWSAASGRSEWLYGVVAGLDVTKTATRLMAELHATSRTNFTRRSADS